MNRHKDTIVISGANGNIGYALAERFAREGKHLLLLYHQNRERIDKLATEYPELTNTMAIDLRDRKTTEHSLSELVNQKKLTLSAFLHTAAMRSIDTSPLVSADPLVWQQIVEVNLIGTFNLLQVVIKLMQEQQIDDSDRRYRHILLFGSDVTRIGLPNGSAYAATKAAVANLTKTLSKELARSNILINTISPGPIRIDDSHFSPEYRAFREKYYNEMLTKTPLGRVAEPADVVSLCSYLISVENSFITGEEFFLNGGKF